MCRSSVTLGSPASIREMRGTSPSNNLAIRTRVIPKAARRIFSALLSATRISMIAALQLLHEFTQHLQYYAVRAFFRRRGRGTSASSSRTTRRSVASMGSAGASMNRRNARLMSVW